MKRELCALAIALVSTACSRPSTVVEIDFDPDALAETARAVEVFVVGACEPVTRGSVPTGASERVTLRRGEATTPLGATPAGEFAVYALARNEACEVVASGCTDTTRGETRIVVPVSAASGDACEAGRTCVRGACEVGDADAGIDASEAPDTDVEGGEDAGLVCAPSCAAGLVCTAHGCAPTTTSAEGYGDVSSEAFATCATDDGAGALFVAGTFGASVTFDHVASGAITNGDPAADAFLVRQSGGAGDWVMQIELSGSGEHGITDAAFGAGYVWITGGAGTGDIAFVTPGCARRSFPVSGDTAFVARAAPSTGCVADVWFTTSAPTRAITVRDDGDPDGPLAFFSGAGGGATVLDTTTVSVIDTRAWVAMTRPERTHTVLLHSLRGDGTFHVPALVATSSLVCVGGWHEGNFLYDATLPAAADGAFLQCVTAAAGGVARWTQITPDGTVLALAVDEAADTLYAAGTVDGRLVLRRDAGMPLEIVSGEDDDVWLAAFRLSTGGVLWGRHFVGPSDDRPHTLSIGPNGDLYLSTSFARSVDLDGAGGVAGWDPPDGGLAIARFALRGDEAPVLVWQRALIESRNTFPMRVLGYGLHVAHVGADLSFAFWSRGDVDVDGTLLAGASPFFVARYHESP